MLAHRYGWTLAFGPLDGDTVVCHTCDNPPCQNPAHWFAGTQAINVEDCVRKGRRAPQRGERNHAAKLTDFDVAEIRRRYGSGLATQVALAREFGVAKNYVSALVRGRSRPPTVTPLP